MPPSTSRSSEVAATRIPLRISHTIMVRDAELLDARAPLALLPVRFLVVEVQIPELELRLAGRADGGEDDVTALGRPPHGVAGAAGERP
jgi:hypothetical protein